MALNKKNMQEIMEEFNNFGMILSFILENKEGPENKVLISKIKSIFTLKNFEQVKWYLNDVISSFNFQDENTSFTYYQEKLSRTSCFNQVIIGCEEEFSEDTISHLIDDDTYEKAMNIHYTNKVLDFLLEITLEEEQQKQIEKYKKILEDIHKNFTQEFTRKSNNKLVEQKVG